MLTDRNVTYTTELPEDKDFDLIIYDARAHHNDDLSKDHPALLARFVLPYVDGNEKAQALALAMDEDVVPIVNWLNAFCGFNRLAWFVVSNPQGRAKDKQPCSLREGKLHALWYATSDASLATPSWTEDTVMSGRRFPEAFAERVAPSKTLILQADYSDSIIYALREQQKGSIIVYDPDISILLQLHDRLRKFNGIIL